MHLVRLYQAKQYLPVARDRLAVWGANFIQVIIKLEGLQNCRVLTDQHCHVFPDASFQANQSCRPVSLIVKKLECSNTMHHSCRFNENAKILHTVVICFMYDPLNHSERVGRITFATSIVMTYCSHFS